MTDIEETEITRGWRRGSFDAPIVSVRCAAYNHEKYIEECLDSFLMQITDFAFEVVVHDDASTDRTAQIIREYEKRFPHIIRPIYEAENQTSKDGTIVNEIMDRACRGRYMAYCEGDDFWTDSEKLQKQYEIMEENDAVTMCCHTVRLTDEAGAPTGARYPNHGFRSNIIELQDYLDYVGYPLQTSSFFARSELVKRYHLEKPAFMRVVSIGDKPLCLYLLANGPIWWIDSEMSCYRRFSAGSWSIKTMMDKEAHSRFLFSLVRMYQEFDRYTGGAYDCHTDGYLWNYYFFNDDYKPLLGPEFERIRKQKGLLICCFVRVCAALPFTAKIIRPIFDRNVRRAVLYNLRTNRRREAVRRETLKSLLEEEKTS